MRQVLLGLSAATIVLAAAAAASAQDAPDAPAGPDSRLFIGATAHSVPAGHGYFSVHEFSLLSIQIGVTDRFSVGAGTPWMIPGKVMWFSPKYEVYRSPALSVAAGMVHVAIPGEGGLNVTYGVTTTGGAARSVTAGVGVATPLFDDSVRSHAIVGMIGGERRISERVSVVTENYVLRGVALVSVGVRRTRGDVSYDLGLMMPIIPNGFGAAPPAPLANVAWRF